MASTTTSATSGLISPVVADTKTALRAHATNSVGLPALPHSSNVASIGQLPNASYCRRMARNVIAMATGDATAELTATELPEIVKKVQEAWDKIDDKYAATSLGVAAFIALWSTTGMISAIDRLPVVPGVMEIVGIGYTGWFAYKNLIFKPDRQAFVAKLKGLYNEILG
ncbi:photosystem I P subunit [Carex rostrata]